MNFLLFLITVLTLDDYLANEKLMAYLKYVNTLDIDVPDDSPMVHMTINVHDGEVKINKIDDKSKEDGENEV